VDIDGFSLIHYACKYGDVNSIETYEKLGANICVLSNAKQTPLHIAAKYGKNSCCIYLLSGNKYKNFINEKDNDGLTPLHLAARNGYLKIVQILMQSGALIYRSFIGNNPFHEASKNGYTDCMKCILSIDSSVLNSENKDGVTIEFTSFISLFFVVVVII
jgi:transient receptor potential cation channel subfamily A member 1